MLRQLFKLAISLVALGVLALWSAPRALAADQVVNNCANDTELRADLAAMQSSGGGALTFNCGVKTIYMLTVLPTISTNTTIKGDGKITLSGLNETRLFIVASGAILTLDNMILRDGYNAGDGGAILSNGNLVIHQSTFRNNTTSNTAAGGAIASYGLLSIENSLFENNKAGNGGALFPKWSGSWVTIRNSHFNNNETTDTESVGASNGWGGGILVWDGPDVTIEDSTFTGNKAVSNYGTGGGGAIYLFGPSSLTMERSTLQDGKAEDAGALYLAHGSTANVQGSTIKNNFGSYGGGIRAREDSVLIMHNSTISGNKNAGSTPDNVGCCAAGFLLHGKATFSRLTITGNISPGIGGGLYLGQGADVTLTDSTVNGNSAAQGGGIGLLFEPGGPAPDPSLIDNATKSRIIATWRNANFN